MANRRKWFTTDEQLADLVALYKDSDMSQLSRLYGCCGTTIKEALRRAGVTVTRKRREDLTGWGFGRWTVLRMEEDDPKRCWCRCTCGREKSVLTGALRDGVSRSCGCLRAELARQRVGGQTDRRADQVEREVREGKSLAEISREMGVSRERVRQLFLRATGGKGIVEMGLIELRKPKWDSAWDASLGSVPDRELARAKGVPCVLITARRRKLGVPAWRKPARDLTGQRFGRLVVVRSVGRDSWSGILWECQCDCGQVRVAKTQFLVDGRQKSCGCLVREMRANGGHWRWSGGYKRNGEGDEQEA